MSKKAYSEYLKSKHWREIRNAAIVHADRRCQLCDSSKGLQVHHRNYKSLGQERLDDVVVLCGACHHAFHFPGDHLTDVWNRYCADVEKSNPKRAAFLSITLPEGLDNGILFLACPNKFTLDRVIKFFLAEDLARIGENIHSVRAYISPSKDEPMGIEHLREEIARIESILVRISGAVPW